MYCTQTKSILCIFTGPSQWKYTAWGLNCGKYTVMESRKIETNSSIEHSYGIEMQRKWCDWLHHLLNDNSLSLLGLCPIAFRHCILCLSLSLSSPLATCTSQISATNVSMFPINYNRIVSVIVYTLFAIFNQWKYPISNCFVEKNHFYCYYEIATNSMTSNAWYLIWLTLYLFRNNVYFTQQISILYLRNQNHKQQFFMGFSKRTKSHTAKQIFATTQSQSGFDKMFLTYLTIS